MLLLIDTNTHKIAPYRFKVSNGKHLGDKSPEEIRNDLLALATELGLSVTLTNDIIKSDNIATSMVAEALESKPCGYIDLRSLFNPEDPHLNANLESIGKLAYYLSFEACEPNECINKANNGCDDTSCYTALGLAYSNQRYYNDFNRILMWGKNFPPEIRKR